jgi:hypothetical protein
MDSGSTAGHEKYLFGGEVIEQQGAMGGQNDLSPLIFCDRPDRVGDDLQLASTMPSDI